MNNSSHAFIPRHASRSGTTASAAKAISAHTVGPLHGDVGCCRRPMVNLGSWRWLGGRRMNPDIRGRRPAIAEPPFDDRENQMTGAVDISIATPCAGRRRAPPCPAHR